MDAISLRYLFFQSFSRDFVYIYFEILVVITVVSGKVRVVFVTPYNQCVANVSVIVFCSAYACEVVVYFSL